MSTIDPDSPDFEDYTDPPELLNHECTLYYCPTVNEVESECHGGFDVCCSDPEKHSYDQRIIDVKLALSKLDGTTASAVRLLTGLTSEEIDDLGGLSS